MGIGIAFYSKIFGCAALVKNGAAINIERSGGVGVAYAHIAGGGNGNSINTVVAKAQIGAARLGDVKKPLGIGCGRVEQLYTGGVTAAVFGVFNP